MTNNIVDSSSEDQDKFDRAIFGKNPKRSPMNWMIANKSSVNKTAKGITVMMNRFIDVVPAGHLHGFFDIFFTLSFYHVYKT